MILSIKDLTEVELYKLNTLKKNKTNIKKLLIECLNAEYERNIEDKNEITQENVIYYLYKDDVRRGILLERADSGGYIILNENGKKMRKASVYFNIEDAIKEAKELEAELNDL